MEEIRKEMGAAVEQRRGRIPKSATVEETYKARDVEEKIDIYFYRRLGFLLAKFADRWGVTPNVISVVGISIGMIAGHFFYYDSISLNVLGMLLWVVSNVGDSADGQLARMTGQTSELGRVLDGLGGGLVFFSMYIHISLRYVEDGGEIGWYILPLALLAGFAHSAQSAVADYFRNGYLRYGTPEGNGELTDLEDIKRRFRELSWSEAPLRKFGMRVYVNYTTQQEFLTRGFQKFRETMRTLWEDRPPQEFRAHYRALNKPLLKYYNYLTINGRVLTLFAFVLAGFPVYFFLLEIVGMTALLLVVLRSQNRRLRLLARLAQEECSEKQTVGTS